MILIYFGLPLRPDVEYLPNSGELLESVQISCFNPSPGYSELRLLHDRQEQLNCEALMTAAVSDGCPVLIKRPGEYSVEVVNSSSASSSTSLSIPEHFSSLNKFLWQIKIN